MQGNSSISLIGSRVFWLSLKHGYRFLHVPKGHSRGGGLGLLFKDSLQINNHIKTFELMDIHFRSLQSVRVLLIYRPPDNTSTMLFLEEFSVLPEQTMAESTGNLIISGDSVQFTCRRPP